MFLLILLQPAPPPPPAPPPWLAWNHSFPGGSIRCVFTAKWVFAFVTVEGWCRPFTQVPLSSVSPQHGAAAAPTGPARLRWARGAARPPARHGTAGLPVPAPSDSSELTGGPHLCFSPAGVVGSPVPQGHPCRLQGLHPVPLPRQSAEKGPELGPTASSLPGPHFPPGLPDGAFGLRWPQAQAAPGRGLCTAPHEHRPPSVLWPRAA